MCASGADIALRFRREQGFYAEAVLISEQNVEIARRAFEAATRRPKPDWPTTNALYHPDHELVATLGETHRGADGYRDWMKVMDETSESWEVHVEEATAIDKDRVLLVWSATIRGTQSHAAASQRLAALLTIQDGKVTRTENYSSPERAREAAGLPEQDAHGDFS